MSNNLIKLSELQSYTTKTIDLVKKNFSKRNETITNIEIVNEQLSTDTEARAYLKFYYIDDGEVGSDGTTTNHVVYRPLYANSDSETSIYHWEPNHEYVEGDLVVYNDNLYKCNVASVNESTFDSSKYISISGDGQDVFVVEKYTSLPDETFTEPKTAYVLNSEQVPIYNIFDGSILGYAEMISGTYTFDVASKRWVSDKAEEEKEEKELLQILKDHKVPIEFLENVEVTNADGSISNELKYDGKLLLTEGSSLETSSTVEEWKSNQEYAQGNLVIHNKKFYRCTVATSNKSTFDETDFELIGGSDSEVELDMFVVKNYSSLPTDIFTKEKIAHVLEDEDSNLKGLYVYNVTNNSWVRSIDEESIHTNREVLDKLSENADNRLVFDSKVIAYQEDVKSILEEYEPSKAYEEGIIVISNNKIYKCIQSPQVDDSQITDQDWIEISANYEIATEGEDLDFTTNWWE